MRLRSYLKAFLWCGSYLIPARAEQNDGKLPGFTAESKVVLVPATVIDRRGSIVSGLRPDAFSVTQDNVPQRIISFGEQDLPASVGIVFDTSGSMRSVLPQAKTVIRKFLDVSNPEDEAFLYTVSTRPARDSGFTTDLGSLLERTVFTDAGGSTALLDTIYAALRQSRLAHNPRKALLIVSDGMDNHSRYSRGELIAAAVEADLQIYSIAVYTPPLTKKPIELQEERAGLALLEELSGRTGGLYLRVRNSSGIALAASQMASAIRNQYVIGYTPSGTGPDTKWHSIKVSLNLSGATVMARSGFYGR